MLLITTYSMGLNQLTPKQIRRVVMLRGLGYNKPEIASILNVSQQTIFNHLIKLKRQAEEPKTDLAKLYWELMIDTDAMKIIIAMMEKDQ